MRKGPVISDQQGEHLTASSHGEHFSVASDTLVSDIQDTADALEEADGRLQVKLMVYSAVLKGILSAVEVDGREPKASGESNPSVLKAKTEDITDGLLISMLHEEEEELIKLVENNHLKRRHPALENVKKELTNGDTNLPEATENYRDNQKKALQDAYFLVQAVSLSVQTLKQEALLMSAKLQGCVNVAAESPDMEVEDPGYDLESRHIFENLHKMLQRVVKDIHLVGDYVAGQQNKEIQSRPVLNRWRTPKEAAEGKLGSFAPGFDFYAQDKSTLDERVVGEDMQTLFRADTAISHLKQKLVHGKSKSHFGHLGGEVLSSDLKEQFTRRYSDNHLQEFSEQVIEVPENFGDDDLLGRSISVAEQGIAGEPRLGREKGISEKELMVNLQENAWKIQVENSIILSVLDGLSRTWHQSQTKRREEVQSERDEAPCSRLMVPELQKELTSCPPNVSDGRTPPQAEGQEQLPDIKVSSPRARFESQVGRPQQQYVEGSLETANLVRNLKAGLLARIGAEKERAERLEEALVDQQWKSEVELDIFTTLLWEGSADNGSMRSVNEPLDCRETQPYQRHGEEPRDQRADMSCDASDSTKRVPNELSETSSLAYGEGESGRTDEGLSNGQEVPQSDPGAIKVLERQNAELRRENEKLAERQTDEIYTLKREFYRELDKVQRQLRQLDPESSQRSGTEASLAQRALSDLKMVWTKKMQDEIAQDLKSGGSRASETAGLSRVGSSKYEKNPVGIQQSGDFLPSLVSALDKEGDLEPTCSRVRNSPAASLSGEVVDNTAHTSEMNETIAQDTRTVNEDVVNESSASKEVESSPVEGPKSGSCASSGHEASNLGSEETFEGSPSADAGKKIQTKGSVSKQLDEDPNQRLNFNLRDRETQTHELHFQGVGTPTSSSVDCLSSTQDLQKAETEVDMLGDEVDSLMDLLEKVYYVLNHYAPIIQCYPGIADLLALVRQEVFQRIQES